MILPRRIASCTGSGSSNSRIKLAMVERSSFSRPASSSCVQPYWSRYFWNEAAFSSGIEVFALQVFDDGQFGHLAVVGLDHIDGHVDPSRLDRRPQPALAGDQLVTIMDTPDHYRLQQPVGRNALDQRLHFARVKLLTRLGRIAVDLPDVHPRGIAHRFTGLVAVSFKESNAAETAAVAEMVGLVAETVVPADTCAGEWCGWAKNSPVAVCGISSRNSDSAEGAVGADGAGGAVAVGRTPVVPSGVVAGPAGPNRYAREAAPTAPPDRVQVVVP